MPSEPVRSRVFSAQRLALCLALVLALVPFPVRAQDHAKPPLEDLVRQVRQCPGQEVDEVLDRVLSAALDNQLEPEQARSILTLFLDACDQSLPLDPLADKTAEGLAKRVPGSRLLPVLQNLSDDMAFAAERLGPDAQPAAVAQAGSALAAGMDRADFQAVLDLAPEAPPAMWATALEATALMLAQGYPRQPLLDLMALGLKQGKLTPEWRHLPTLAVRAEKRGLDRERILAVARDALDQGRTIRQFMEDLGFTGRDLQHGGTAMDRTEM